MAFDPKKTQAENRADLKQQIEDAERELNGNVMARFNLSDDEWDALSQKVRDILTDYYESML